VPTVSEEKGSWYSQNYKQEHGKYFRLTRVSLTKSTATNIHDMKQDDTTILSHNVLIITYSSKATYTGMWRLAKLLNYLYCTNTWCTLLPPYLDLTLKAASSDPRPCTYLSNLLNAFGNLFRREPFPVSIFTKVANFNISINDSLH
jgi:hypothetical protein